MLLLDTSRYTINNAERVWTDMYRNRDSRLSIVASSNDMFDNTYVVSMLQEDNGPMQSDGLQISNDNNIALSIRQRIAQGAPGVPELSDDGTGPEGPPVVNPALPDVVGVTGPTGPLVVNPALPDVVGITGPTGPRVVNPALLPDVIQPVIPAPFNLINVGDTLQIGILTRYEGRAPAALVAEGVDLFTYSEPNTGSVIGLPITRFNYTNHYQNSPTAANSITMVNVTVTEITRMADGTVRYMIAPLTDDIINNLPVPHGVSLAFNGYNAEGAKFSLANGRNYVTHNEIITATGNSGNINLPNAGPSGDSPNVPPDDPTGPTAGRAGLTGPSGQSPPIPPPRNESLVQPPGGTDGTGGTDPNQPPLFLLVVQLMEPDKDQVQTKSTGFNTNRT